MNRTEALAYLKSQGANVEALNAVATDKQIVELAEGIGRLLSNEKELA